MPLRVRVHAISGEPMRVAEADRDGRFAWEVPFSYGTSVPALVPGVPLGQLRDHRSTGAGQRAGVARFR